MFLPPIVKWSCYEIKQTIASPPWVWEAVSRFGEENLSLLYIIWVDLNPAKHLCKVETFSLFKLSLMLSTQLNVQEFCSSRTFLAVVKYLILNDTTRCFLCQVCSHNHVVKMSSLPQSKTGLETGVVRVFSQEFVCSTGSVVSGIGL